MFVTLVALAICFVGQKHCRLVLKKTKNKKNVHRICES